MNRTLDDPKLTAYALGELDEAEAKEVEARLAEDEPARRYVQETQELAERLTEELHREPAPALTEEQREAVVLRSKRKPARWRLRVAASIAAAVVLAGVLVALLKTTVVNAPGRTMPLADSCQAAPEGLRKRLAAMDNEAPAAGRAYGSFQPPQHVTKRDSPVTFDLRRLKTEGAPPTRWSSRNYSSNKKPERGAEARTERAAGYDVDAIPTKEAEQAPATPAMPAAKLASTPTPRPAAPPRTKVQETFFKEARESAATDGAVAPANRLPRPGPHNTEAYDAIVENPFKRVADDPLSTFSIDVDTASYANVRRFLSRYRRPPKGAVRIEELINYFKYDYAPPTDGEPFAAHVEVSDCPWNMKHRLIRIGLKGKVPPKGERPACNLVFLLDVSGSMNPSNKLPLVREAMKLLVSRLRDADRVAIVVYAGASGLVLDSTPCTDKARIVGALDRLRAGGSTNGGAGIQLAYRVAEAHFIPKGVNRVILCTDGDFNVGTTDRSSLVGLIKKKAKSGVFLTVLGFGMGNYKDGALEQLADKGNGNYGYVDTLREAQKLFVDQLAGTLITIAKDVKIQVEFNPSRVAAYRLIGYENRMLRHQDFNDDTKDAGEIGAGHTVTALYEIVPAGGKVDVPGVDPLKYQKPVTPTKAADSGEVMTLKLRYKQPDGDKSKLMVSAVKDAGEKLDKASRDFKFTASVAMFGLVLRDSKHKGTATLDGVIELAGEGKGPDKKGYRAEFIGLAKKAKAVLKK